MDFASTVIFLILYYLRPQEWTSLLASIHFVQLIMIFALMTLFFRERSVRVGDLLKTPHDWAMLGFLVWMVASSNSPWTTFGEVKSLFIFYIVIVQVFTSLHRITLFCSWWTFLIVAIAALAVASQFGFDPLGSYDLTMGRMKERLALNLSIFKNPNALGHNVVPAIPMLYYFCIWKRPLFMKEIGLFLIGLPIYCVYLTVSKGSFLTGALAVLITSMFGRPRWLQIAIVCFGIAFGGTLLWALPRMNELNRSKTDGAIQGRVAAFTHGKKMIETRPRGIGFGQWMVSFRRAHSYGKAAHSSYVQVGAELGYPGLYLMLLIFYCNLRTLITAQTRTIEEERVRRTLFLLVISYLVSSWMVDLGYRPTFFMFSAAIAAFHRHLHGIYGNQPVPAPDAPPTRLPWLSELPQPALQPATHLAPASPSTPAGVAGVIEVEATVLTVEQNSPAATLEGEDGESRIGGGWNRLNVRDLAITGAVTFALLRFWSYLITRM